MVPWAKRCDRPRLQTALTSFSLHLSARTLTPTHWYASQMKKPTQKVCFFSPLSVYTSPPPQKDFKTRKKEKHATKIPSSRGLFIEDSSCFFVSGPRVKKKRGEKEKRENSKKITGKNGKKKNIKKRKEARAKRTNQQEFMCAYCCFFCSFKKSTKKKQKASQTQIYHKKRHKIKENPINLDVISFAAPLQKKMAAIVYCPAPSFYFSLSPSPPLPFQPCLCPACRFRGGGESDGEGRGEWVERNTEWACVVWRTGPGPFLRTVIIRTKRDSFEGKTQNRQRTGHLWRMVSLGSWCSNPQNCNAAPWKDCCTTLVN